MIGEKFSFWDPCFICLSDITTKMEFLPTEIEFKIELLPLPHRI